MAMVECFVFAILVSDCFSLTRGQPGIDNCETDNSMQIDAKRDHHQLADTISGGISTNMKLTKADPLLVLLEEISRLKLDLMPHDTDLATSPKKAVPTRRETPTGDLPGVLPLAQSLTKGSHLDQLTACQRSIGVATSGYRLLCRKEAIAKTGSIEQQNFSPPTRGEAEAKTEGLVESESADIRFSVLQRLLKQIEQS